MSRASVGPLVALCAVSACGGSQSAAIDIVFRMPAGPGFLDGVDAFVFSVDDARGQALVLRRFSATEPLRLAEIPYGTGLRFSLDGLFMDTPIVEGRSCSVDVLSGRPLPHVAMFLGPVGAFSPTASPAGAERAGAIALPRQDGRILFAGGRTPDGTIVAVAQQYDARDGLWAADHDLSVARAEAVWAPVPGGALVVGGVAADGAPVAELDRYDEVTGFHTLSTDAALGLTGVAVAPLPGGAVLIAGGASSDGVAVNLAWVFDGTGVRSVSGGMASPRRAHTLSLVGTGNFTAAFAIGGYGADGAPLGTIELYDPRATASVPFSTKPAQLSVPRARHTATVLATGEILVVGGVDAQGAPVREAELFDPITSAVRSAGILADGRAEHTATLLADGRVLIIGGTGRAGVLGSAEIYDPAVGNFAAARALGVARTRHVAIPLCDGTILVAGGAPGAELYGPKR
jgi:large repetitive protein